MTDRLPRPARHLVALMRRYPGIGAAVDKFRAGRGAGLPRWPDWCLLPMAAWQAIAAESGGAESPLAIADATARLAAIGAWRYSQGIYRLDPDMRAALVDTPVSGALPASVLTRLPEWSIYIETPGLAWQAGVLHGCWAHLEWDVETGRTELRLLLDREEGLTALPVHLGRWTLTEAVDRALAEAAANARAIGMAMPPHHEASADLASSIMPLISILLYLCADAPEIDDARRPGAAPQNPVERRTRRGGVRLFPAAAPRVWTVGAQTGQALRQAGDPGASGRTGRRVRAHLRRGHWHGYWTGPRSGEQTFVYRWIAPLIAGR